MTDETPSMTRTRPVLVLGCAQLGNLYRERTDEDAFAILDAAWEAGIRQFDTAPHYGIGLSERRLGEFLRTKPRHEYVVSTKVGRLLIPDLGGSSAWDPEGFRVPATFQRRWDFSERGVLASLEASLERLGLDRVDIALIHDPDEHAEEAIHAAVPALARLREEHLVRSIGVGNRDTRLLTRFVRETPIDVIMLAGRYTLLDQSALDTLLPACLGYHVGVLNAGVFNSGILATEDPDASAHFEYATAPPGILARASAIAEVCEGHGTTLPAAALAFAGAHPAVTAIVAGADDPVQVRALRRRLQQTPPTALWTALTELGLIRGDGLPGHGMVSRPSVK